MEHTVAAAAVVKQVTMGLTEVVKAATGQLKPIPAQLLDPDYKGQV